MEEFFIFVLEFLFELALEALAYGGFDFGLSLLRDDKEKTGCGILAVFFAVGAIVGGLSRFVWPQLLLPVAGLRVLNILIGPPVVGTLAWVWTDWRRRRGRELIPWNHFWYALCFTFAFDVVRYLIAER